MPIIGVIASSTRQGQTTDLGAMFPLQVITVGPTVSSINFTNIPQTYTHLHIRGIVRMNSLGWVQATLNNDSTSSYINQYMYGAGTSVVAGNYGQTSIMYWGPYNGGTTANAFGPSITDILDYSSTTKNKTLRQYWQGSNNEQMWFQVNTYLKTNAITSIQLSADFATYSQFALYGVKSA
jgi:hypothetical protein